MASWYNLWPFGTKYDCSFSLRSFGIFFPFLVYLGHEKSGKPESTENCTLSILQKQQQQQKKMQSKLF
jgi:hypothetical protein